MKFDGDHKYECCHCNTVSSSPQLLVLGNPFLPKDIVRFCPKCKQPEAFRVFCAADGCQREAQNSITPIPNGMVAVVCNMHYALFQQQTGPHQVGAHSQHYHAAGLIQELKDAEGVASYKMKDKGRLDG